MMMSMANRDVPASDEEDESTERPNGSEEEDGEEVDKDRVREAMHRLKGTTDYLTESCTEDLKVINAAVLPSAKRTSSMIEEIRELGLAPLFAAIYKRCFHLEWTVPSGRLVVINMYFVAGAMWNGTDNSAALCQQVVDLGLVGDLFNYLNDPKVDPDNLTENGISYCVRPMLSILHNVVQKCDAARQAYRDANAVDILTKFRAVTDTETKCVVNFVLAYIVTEEENDKINNDDDNIAFIINMLRQVYNLKTGPRPHGFHTEELLQGLNKLANNDSNKVRIVRMLALPLYTELLTIGNQREQKLAAQGIWRLAFRCKDFISQEPGCIAALQKLASSGDGEVNKDANGALWELGEHKNNAIEKTAERKQSMRTATLDDGSMHIMISYQWSSQDLMKRISKRLKEAGYKVWMDVDNMSKSPLEAMAAAVEDACVVLIAASRKYKESESCRTEGVYAYNLRRDIVPLIVETGYRPDGWLGPLVLNNLYFDFSKKKTVFEKKMLELIKELGSRGKSSSATKGKEVLVQKVVDSSTVHSPPRPPNDHEGDNRGHGEDFTDGPCEPTVVKQPTPVTVLPPADASTGCTSCLCCFRPCHRHVKIHPEEQDGQPNGARAVHISWCCSTVDVEF